MNHVKRINTPNKYNDNLFHNYEEIILQLNISNVGELKRAEICFMNYINIVKKLSKTDLILIDPSFHLQVSRPVFTSRPEFSTIKDFSGFLGSY